MYGDDNGRFGGVAGRVLREAISGGTFLTGFVLVVPVVLVSLVLARAGAGGAGAKLGQLVAIFALARVALNGYAGQSRGTVFSKVGGDTWDVVIVALRYGTLTLVWMIPLHLLGFDMDASRAGVASMFLGWGGGKAIVLGAIYLTAMALSPPVFLIVSVGASNFAEIFLPSHWRDLFEGRKGDIFLVYALYLGGLALTGLLMLPITAIATVANRNFGLLFGGCAILFLAGLGVTLLGRLCGFFAVGGETEQEDPSEIVPSPIPGRSPDPDRPARGSGPRSPVLRMIESKAMRDSSTLRNLDALSGAMAGRSTPITDLAARVDGAVRLFETDREKAIDDLESLDEKSGSNPVVLSALARLQLRDERAGEAVVTARQAIVVALQKGSQRQAAELFRDFFGLVDELELKPDEILRLGNTLRSSGDFPSAAKTYRFLIERGRGDTAAVKGLLQVAEAYLNRKGAPVEALEHYNFLLEKCPDSPLSEFMREGQVEAERKLSRQQG